MASLSEVGLVPRLDVLPLAEVDLKYPVSEPPETAPKFMQKVSLGDVIGETGHWAGTPSVGQLLHSAAAW